MRLCSQWKINLNTGLDVFHLNRNKKIFLLRYVKMDETWVNHYTLELSQRGSLVIEKNLVLASKAVKTQQLVVKFMASRFCDVPSISYTEIVAKTH